MLQQSFTRLAGLYTADSAIINRLWTEIETAYSHPKRHYHTLQHLENLLTQLQEVKPQISDWDTVLFALYYHDIVYKATRKDNEEKSAELARKRLEELQYPADKIARCVAHILATKTHALSEDTDTNLFTDADLGILGADTQTYMRYAAQVRQEYAIYPDFMYNPGRKKVLQHFLRMEHIFKTEYFREKLEGQARRNMELELG